MRNIVELKEVGTSLVARCEDGTLWRLERWSRWYPLPQIPSGALPEPVPVDPPAPTDPDTTWMTLPGPRESSVVIGSNTVAWNCFPGNAAGEVYLFGWPSAHGSPNVFYRPGGKRFFVGITSSEVPDLAWLDAVAKPGGVRETIGKFHCVEIDKAQPLNARAEWGRTLRVFEENQGSTPAAGFIVQIYDAEEA